MNIRRVQNIVRVDVAVASIRIPARVQRKFLIRCSYRSTPGVSCRRPPSTVDISDASYPRKGIVV